MVGINVGRPAFPTQNAPNRTQTGSLPGAYKIGHNEMLRIRDQTRRRLGSRFDIKAFHDLVLLSGSMPLEVLSSLENDWDGDRLS